MYLKQRLRKTISLFTAVCFLAMSFPTTYGFAEEVTQIAGDSIASKEQMVQFYENYSTIEYPQTYIDESLDLEKFVDLVIQESQAEGIRADVVFTQIIVDTEWLSFDEMLTIEQYNFGKLKDLDGKYATFDSMEVGIRAFVQHLKAYASIDPLNQECVDPLFDSIIPKGNYKNVEDLGSGIWSDDLEYAQKIKEKLSQIENTETITTNDFKQDSNINDQLNEDTNSLSKADTMQVNAVTEKTLTGLTIIEDLIITEGEYVGQVYKVDASASSDNGVLYRYRVKDLQTGSWPIVEAYTENTTWNWTPSKPGKYLIGIDVKDKNSGEIADTHLYKEVVVKESASTTKINNLTITEGQYVGQEYKVEALASSINGVLYRYRVKDLQTGGWYIVEDYRDSTTWSWTPSKPGKYLVGIDVKDKYSETVGDTHLYKEVTVKESASTTKINNLTITEGQYVGQEYKVEASASSINGVLYRYRVKDLQTGGWYIVEDYRDSTTWSWTPSKPGKYLVGIDVKDKYSETVGDTYLYKEVTVASPSTTTKINDLNITEGQYAGQEYKVGASASSINGVLYRYRVKNLQTGGWYIVEDYRDSTTWSWTPSKPGKYLVGIDVKDKYSETIGDTYLYKEVTVASPSTTTKINDLNITEGQYAGQEYKVEASASSINGVLYRYRVKDLQTGGWYIVEDYRDSTTWSWTPNKPGKYLVGVDVKDKYSETVGDTHLYKEITVSSPILYFSSYYKQTLDEVVNKQMALTGGSVPKGYYGGIATREEVKYYLDSNNFLQFTTNQTKLIEITADVLNIRKDHTTSSVDIGDVYKDEQYAVLEESSGWFKITAHGVTGWVSGNYVTEKSQVGYLTSIEINISSGNLNLRKDPTISSADIGDVHKGEVYIVQGESKGWYQITVDGVKGWISGDYAKMVNNVPQDMYQFLILSGSSNISVTDLNTELQGKGILQGEGQSFIDAGKNYNVNEVYLLAHALHESGNGKSLLANGLRFDANDKLISKEGYIIGSDGKTTKNKGKEPYSKIVYNMYGIGAVDSNALAGGAQYALSKGWYTPRDAIIGGAEFIAKGYIKVGQDTLYKMRWNPSNPATHQYATDVGWAVKQTWNIEMVMDICEKYNSTILKFDIPSYKRQ